MYIPFKDEDGQEFGSCEVFFIEDDTEELPIGWYWWACFPGCLPDGDPIGPFDTEEEAIHNAQNL
jgi:hypothetical protein